MGAECEASSSVGRTLGFGPSGRRFESGLALLPHSIWGSVGERVVGANPSSPSLKVLFLGCPESIVTAYAVSRLRRAQERLLSMK